MTDTSMITLWHKRALDSGATRRRDGDIAHSAKAPTPSYTLNEIHTAWRETGVDIAGVEWERFVGALKGQSK